MHHPFLENIYIESPQLVLYKYTQVAHNLPSKLLHSCSKTSRQTGYSRFAVLRAILSLQQASFLIPPPANSTKKIGLVGNCLQRLKSFRTQFRQRLWHDSCCVLSTHLQLPIIRVHSPEFLPPYSIYSSYIIWEKKLTKEPETLWNFMMSSCTKDNWFLGLDDISVLPPFRYFSLARPTLFRTFQCLHLSNTGMEGSLNLHMNPPYDPYKIWSNYYFLGSQIRLHWFPWI